jgi:hypothetical protein
MRLFKKEFWNREFSTFWNVVIWIVYFIVAIYIINYATNNNDWHEIGEFQKEGSEFVLYSHLKIVKEPLYNDEFKLTVYLDGKETIVEVESLLYDNSKDMLRDLEKKYYKTKRKLKNDPYFSIFK